MAVALSRYQNSPNKISDLGASIGIRWLISCRVMSQTVAVDFQGFPAAIGMSVRHESRHGRVQMSVVDGSFSDGFELGYRLIKGIHVGMPGTPGNTTPFLQGIEAGIKAAGGMLTKQG